VGESQAIRKLSSCLIDVPSEVKDSAFCTNSTDRDYIGCSDGVGSTSSLSCPSSVASFSRAIPIKTYWYQDFFSFFPFSMFLK
jgi:hypothetical protein